MNTVSTAKAPAAIGPYSQAQVIGRIVFTSGQIGIDPETGSLNGGVEVQARQAFNNVSAILEAAGSSLSKVIKTTLFIRNMNDFAKINAIYAEFFKEPYPARSCVQVERLPKDALIECEVIAEI